MDEIADDLIRHFALSTNLIFGNSKRTLEMLADRLHERVRREQWPADPFVVHHGSLSKDLREDAEATLKSGVPTTALCSSTLEMGLDIGHVRAVGQIAPTWSVASMVQRLGRSGRRAGEAAILRLYVREASPHRGSTVTDLLYPDLLRAIALTLILAGKRWRVEEILPAQKLVFVVWSPGGKAPPFRGSAGEVHGRVVREMKVVLLDDDEPAYLDENSRRLLRAARRTARAVGLAERDLIIGRQNVQWFPWVGTSALRTLSLMAKAARIDHALDRLSITYQLPSREAFLEHLRLIATTEPDARALARLLPVKAVEKYDDYVPEALLDEANARNRLDVAEARVACLGALS